MHITLKQALLIISSLAIAAAGTIILFVVDNEFAMDKQEPWPGFTNHRESQTD